MWDVYPMLESGPPNSAREGCQGKCLQKVQVELSPEALEGVH